MWRPWNPLPVETRCLHTGSLATVLPPGRTNVVDLVEREHERGRVTVSYDPNVRPALLGDAVRARPDIEHLVAMSDVVKVSDEDLRWLYPDRRDEEVAQDWLASGPALVVVTRGGAGVYAVSAGLELRRAAVPIDLVDTVGAGDSFTSGLLDGLHRADLDRRRAPRRAGDDRRGNARQRRRRRGPDRRDHLLEARRRPADTS